ncbi:MAG: KH domain-containing protein [Candidatus Diapherotrites archaeon]|nr:KH domain-containing protein [Candidatus Diapherotrites archaeon]
MASTCLLVPEERIGVIIGPKGKTKKRIEALTKTNIVVDSENGEVSITGDDAFQVMVAEKICKAIARGFAPEKAFMLSKDYYELRVLDVRELVGKSQKAIHTKKSRVIGTEGSIRKRIEESCNCYLSVYGDTVSIIGTQDDLDFAEAIVLDILSGAEIETAFRHHSLRKSGKADFDF